MDAQLFNDAPKTPKATPKPLGPIVPYLVNSEAVVAAPRPSVDANVMIDDVRPYLRWCEVEALHGDGFRFKFSPCRSSDCIGPTTARTQQNFAKNAVYMQAYMFSIFLAWQT